MSNDRLALFVGLNRYRFRGAQDLAAPSKDAQNLYRLFSQYSDFKVLAPWPRRKISGTQDSFEVDPDGKLSKRELIAQVRELFRNTDGITTAFFYFAGHGKRDCCPNEWSGKAECESYLCSSDDPHAFPFSELYKLIRDCRANEKIVWLDCCHSGELLEFGPLFAGQRGLFLASSSAFGAAYEVGDHGLFTQKLLSGLKEGLAQSGQVRSSFLTHYLDSYLTGGIQNFRYGEWGEYIELLRNIMPTAPEAAVDLRERLRRQGVDTFIYNGYLKGLLEASQALPLDRIDPKSELRSHRLRLSQVYVELNLIETRPAPLLDQTAQSEPPPQGSGLPALRVIAKPENRFAVLRGDGGSGKTTIAEYLIYRLCSAALGNESTRLKDDLDGLIPVRLLLAELADLIPIDSSTGNAELVWYLVETELTRRCGPIPGRRLCEQLKAPLRHCGFFVLDGLDEIPNQGHARRRVLEALDDFSSQLEGKARILLTTRGHALSDDDRRSDLPSFRVLDLVPMGGSQIDDFIHRWIEAVGGRSDWNQDTVARRGRSLRRLLRESVHLVGLTERPLLLTLVASLYTRHARLPKNLSELFEETVDLLLSRWNLELDQLDASGNPLLPLAVVNTLRNRPARIRDGLQQLAFKLQRLQQDSRTGRPAASGLDAADVTVLFANLLENLATKPVLQSLDQRVGLLLIQPNGQYAFPHHSFQEYLSACHLTDQSDKFEEVLLELVRDNLDGWREVFMFALCKAAQGTMATALSPLFALLPKFPPEGQSITDWHWQACMLGGEVLLVLGDRTVVLANPLGKEVRDRLVGWLVELMKREVLEPKVRAKAGDILGQLGDPREGVSCTTEGAPAIDWVTIEGGGFVFGEGESYRRIAMDRLDIARYPITVDQFKTFIAAGGYNCSELWDDPGAQQRPGWRWRTRSNRAFPNAWEEQTPYGNRPVVGVSWYEAKAFCRWLGNERGELIDLPTEMEWEFAARGEIGRDYPWTDSPEWDDRRGNASGSGIGHPTTVGMYPLGATPTGIRDLAGNVWEWCRDLYRTADTPGVRPLIDSIAREEYSLRGGSWWSPAPTHRCGYRRKLRPVYDDADIGLRLVRRPMSAS